MYESFFLEYSPPLRPKGLAVVESRDGKGISFRFSVLGKTAANSARCLQHVSLRMIT